MQIIYQPVKGVPNIQKGCQIIYILAPLFCYISCPWLVCPTRKKSVTAYITDRFVHIDEMKPTTGLDLHPDLENFVVSSHRHVEYMWQLSLQSLCEVQSYCVKHFIKQWTRKCNPSQELRSLLQIHQYSIKKNCITNTMSDFTQHICCVLFTVLIYLGFFVKVSIMQYPICYQCPKANEQAG